MKKLTLLFSLLILLVAFTPLSRAYIFQTLPITPQFDYPGVFQINENNAIVGVLSGSFGVVGARWSSGGVLTVITSIGPAHSAWTYGINNAGLTAGYLDQNGGPVHAFYNAPGIGSGLLTTPSPLGVSTYLRVINDSGYAAGTYLSSGVQTAYYTHPLGYNANIPSAKVGANFNPWAINNDGDILGTSSLKGVVYNLSSGTAVKVTDRVPTMTAATALNELGDVVGVDSSSTAYILPKLASEPVIHLGAGSVSSVAGTNDARELLVTTTDNRHAVLRQSTSVPDGQFTYLDSSVPAPWTIYYVADINNAGTICGVARRPSTSADGTSDPYVYRAFKLTSLIFTIPFPITFG